MESITLVGRSLFRMLAQALAFGWLAVSTGTDRPRLPDASFGSGWGVNIHHARIEEASEIRLIARSGFRWVRVPIHWSGVEGHKGFYGFRHYDALVDQLERHRVRAMFTLCYGNPHYGAGPPRTPEQRRAFAKFAAAAVKKYAGKGIVWEVWNEPNYPLFWANPNVDEYMALVREVRSAIDASSPGETLIGPATSGIDFEFLQACFDRGALRLFDAVSVHPYRQTNPETALLEYEKLRSMIDAKKPLGKAMPIINSEWGYSEMFQNMTVERQGWYAARMYLTGLAAGVNLNIHFDWKNDPTLPKVDHRTFGAVDEKLEPRPAIREVERAVREMGGFKYLGRIPTAGHIFALAFERNGTYRIAAWSTTAKGTLRYSDEWESVTEQPRYFDADAEDLAEYFKVAEAKKPRRQWDDWPPPASLSKRPSRPRPTDR